jgi:hypothetical protein
MPLANVLTAADGGKMQPGVMKCRMDAELNTAAWHFARLKRAMACRARALVEFARVTGGATRRAADTRSLRATHIVSPRKISKGCGSAYARRSSANRANHLMFAAPDPGKLHLKFARAAVQRANARSAQFSDQRSALAEFVSASAQSRAG